MITFSFWVIVVTLLVMVGRWAYKDGSEDAACGFFMSLVIALCLCIFFKVDTSEPVRVEPLSRVQQGEWVTFSFDGGETESEMGSAYYNYEVICWKTTYSSAWNVSACDYNVILTDKKIDRE